MAGKAFTQWHGTLISFATTKSSDCWKSLAATHASHAASAIVAISLDALHRAAPDAYHRRHLQYALPGSQMRPDGILDLGRYLRTAEPFPLLADTIKPGQDPAAEHRVECGTLLSTLRAADSLILVGLDDQPATMFGHPCQDEALILCV